MDKGWSREGSLIAVTISNTAVSENGYICKVVGAQCLGLPTGNGKQIVTIDEEAGEDSLLKNNLLAFGQQN